MQEFIKGVMNGLLLLKGIDMQRLNTIVIVFLFVNISYAQDLSKVTYLYNSGWLIETPGELILIDYVPADKLSLDTVLFNKLKSETENGKKAFILVSHEHHDHFYEPLLKWHHAIKGLTTILGWNYREKDKFVLTVTGRDSLTIGSFKLTSHPATDAGSGFLVSTGNITFYHAGDHAAWSDEQVPAFKDEITFISRATRKINLAFIPVVRGKLGGCKSMNSITEGAMMALEIMKPAIVFPMHIQCDDLSAYKQFAKQVNHKFPSIVTKIPSTTNYEFVF
jgi:L-ascorbate metabolism protein UlaG (beta-lactamase superfamily)